MERKAAEIVRAVEQGAGTLHRAIPGPMGAYAGLLKEVTKDGALSGRVKELMAIAISIVEGCEGCIAYHTREAIKKGATREEFAETISVAIEMRGGPATVYGGGALALYDDLT